LRRPAPCLGQHNVEVYGRLGISVREVEQLRQEGVV
jgi:crotonobetainyl-CoA:carnitine CoA-transferase CaiB-like acyl-CoA transferase